MHSQQRFRLSFIFLALSFFVSGCSQYRSSSNTALSNLWMTPSDQAQEALNKGPSLYCYGTLGTTECYESPQKGLQERLEGYFEPEGKKSEQPLKTYFI